MLISNYSYLSSINILKKIAKLSGDEKVQKIVNQYLEQLNIDTNVDVIWSLISTSLLMSENMFKNINAYNLIRQKDVDEVVENLNSFSKIFPDELANKPTLLDHNNKPAGAFYEFLIQKEYDNNFAYDDKLYSAVSAETENYYEQLYRQKEQDYRLMRVDGPFGCNDGIISNGLMDIKKFIKKVRNAIAHSNYEVINDNCIRLYNYKEKDVLDFNVTLDISTIMIIVDILNEISYNKLKYFNNYFQHEKFLDSDLFDKENITDEELIEFIMKFNIFDRNMAIVILNQAKESKQNIKFSQNENSSDNYNIFSSIGDIILDYLKPCCEFGSIINNYLYSMTGEHHIADELYNKYGLYNYLKSDIYKSNYAEKEDVVYKKNELELLVLSFLNCSLLATHNEYENENIPYPVIDFSKMEIKSEILDLFEQKHLNSNNLLLDVMQKRCIKIDESVTSKEAFIQTKGEELININISNEYFNDILPKQIKKCQLEVQNLKQEKEILLKEISKIVKNKIGYHYQEKLSDFIYKSLRNSLAHGYVKFRGNIINSLADIEIIFEDYEPTDKNKMTFSGKIKIYDLLKCLSDHIVIVNTYNKNNELIPIKQIKGKITR